MLHERNMFYKCHVIKKDNGTIYIVIGVWLETHIKRHVHIFFFFGVRIFLPYMFSVLYFQKNKFQKQTMDNGSVEVKSGGPCKNVR